jgi:hypothetical protein
MQRDLAGLEAIGVVTIQREIGAAVLQDDAGRSRNHAGAECAIQALNQRRRIATAIDGGDIDGIAGQAAEGRHHVPLQRRSAVDQPAPLGRIFLRYQPSDRHIGKQGIGEHLVAVVIGDLLGLHQEMDMVGPEEILTVQFVGLDEVEHFEHGKALRRRRRIEDRDVAVTTDKGLTPNGLLPAEIGKAKQAACRFREARHLGGDRPLIKAGPAVIRDRLQRPRKTCVGKLRAWLRCRPIGKEKRGGLPIPH